MNQQLIPPHPPGTSPHPPVSRTYRAAIGNGMPSGNRPGGPPTEASKPPPAVKGQIKSHIGVGIPGRS